MTAISNVAAFRFRGNEGHGNGDCVEEQRVMRLGLPRFALRRKPPSKLGEPFRKKGRDGVLALASSLFEKCADEMSIQRPNADRFALGSSLDILDDTRASVIMFQIMAPPDDDNGRCVETQQSSDSSKWGCRIVALYTPIQQRSTFENGETGFLRADFER